MPMNTKFLPDDLQKAAQRGEPPHISIAPSRDCLRSEAHFRGVGTKGVGLESTQKVSSVTL
jgi:hypothetical protein